MIKSFLSRGPNHGVTAVKGISAHSDDHSRGVNIICEALLRARKQRQLGCYGFVPEHGVSWQPILRVRRIDPDDLPTGVDPDGSAEVASRQHAEIGHHTFLVRERVKFEISRHRHSDDLTIFVDAISCANRSAERPEIGHNPITPNKRMCQSGNTRVDLAFADNAALVVYVVRKALGAAERTEVSEHSVVPFKGVKRSARSADTAEPGDLGILIYAERECRCRAERTNVYHHAILPKERPGSAARDLAITCDLAAVIDVVRDTRVTSKCAEIDYRALVPQRGMRWALEQKRLAYDLALIIDPLGQTCATKRRQFRNRVPEKAEAADRSNMQATTKGA